MMYDDWNAGDSRALLRALRHTHLWARSRWREIHRDGQSKGHIPVGTCWVLVVVHVQAAERAHDNLCQFPSFIAPLTTRPRLP